jgi:lactaldehyde reductase
MAVNRIILNETSYFGAGARRMLADEFRGRGYVRAFVVTDKDLIRFGVAGKVTGVLDEAGIAYEIFSDLKPNPTVKNVQAGVEAFRRSGADAIVAIGGGSAMDTAKAVGIIAANPAFGDVVSLEGTAPTANRSVPVFALPTTAGTAAEVTINYVITDEANTKKMVCVDPKDIPAVAIIDAELMAAMPRGLTAATGMDALTHAIEGYITKGAWTLTDMFELKAVELIARWLPAAVENGADTEAREGMAVAQYIAGMGFSNVGLGLVHGMAHPLGAFYDIPHGVANALLLPYVMQYNMESSLVKFGDVARAMGVDTAGMGTRQAAQAAVDAVRTLAVRVGIPQRLSSLGVREEDLPRLAASALADVCTPGNPRDTSAEEILALYREAF